MRGVWPALLVVWLAVGAAAQPASLSELAARLDAARVGLEAARSADDRLAALTKAIDAYEISQAALRAALRQNVLEARQLSTQISAETDQQEALFASLIRLSRLADGGAALHPDGPVATARAGMVLAELLPQLDLLVAALGADAEALSARITAQNTAEAALSEGLTQLQAARREAVEAARRRRDADRDTDQAVLEALARDADTLDALTEQLPRRAETDHAAPQAGILPVRGALLRGYLEPDAAGVARPGWVLASAPDSLVRAPFAASVLYAGPLRGLGNVVVLEPAADHLLLLVGLGALLVGSGTVVAAEQGLGFTSATARAGHTNVTPSGEGAGTHRTDTLYMEARTRAGPVDPAAWFAWQED